VVGHGRALCRIILVHELVFLRCCYTSRLNSRDGSVPGGSEERTTVDNCIIVVCLSDMCHLHLEVQRPGWLCGSVAEGPGIRHERRPISWSNG